jgi:3-mercaptopyruvate sulfurtransferase SseA
MLLEHEAFQDFARSLGIDNDSKVVVYDEKYDAMRVWWAFYLYGKTDVRVLDGGYAAWKTGRIPWAVFQSWKEYRLEVDGKPAGFKPAAEMQQVIDKFKMDRGKEQIFYCHSGVRSTTPVFVLYLMGWDVDRLRSRRSSVARVAAFTTARRTNGPQRRAGRRTRATSSNPP